MDSNMLLQLLFISTLVSINIGYISCFERGTRVPQCDNDCYKGRGSDSCCKVNGFSGAGTPSLGDTGCDGLSAYCSTYGLSNDAILFAKTFNNIAGKFLDRMDEFSDKMGKFLDKMSNNNVNISGNMTMVFIGLLFACLSNLLSY